MTLFLENLIKLKFFLLFKAIYQEIQTGILNEKNSNLKTIAFFRDFENVGSTTQQLVPDLFKENEIEVKVLFNELKQQVRKKLSIPNKYSYLVSKIIT